MSIAHFITSHPTLVVCDASRATELCEDPILRSRIAGLLSFADPPPYKVQRPRDALLNLLLEEKIPVCLVNMRDVVDPTLENGPTVERVRMIINFARKVTGLGYGFGSRGADLEPVYDAKFGGQATAAIKAGKRLVIHCTAGRSRSTAAAFIVLCDQLGPGHEENALMGISGPLVESAPGGPWVPGRRSGGLLHACERTPLPNTLMTQIADDLLGRGGRLHIVAQAQNERPVDAEADTGKPVTGTALLNAIRRGDL